MSKSSREDRKAQIAEATWHVIAQRGINAVSVRNIATQAGIAVGSLRHLFPTQSSLIEFAAQLMIERATARVQAVPASDDVVEYALAIVSAVSPFDPETRHEFEVNVALIAETPAHPPLADIRNQAHAALSQLMIALVALVRGEQQASTQSVADAARLHALVDGLGMHLLHRDPQASSDWARDMVRSELRKLRDSAPRTP